MSDQLFQNLANDGLSESDLGKLREHLPAIEGNTNYLTQTHGMSEDDSAKLVLAIKLLSNLPIPSKLLSIRNIQSKLNQNSTLTNSNLQSNNNRSNSSVSSNKSASNITTSFQTQPYPSYSPYPMYPPYSQIPQVPTSYPGGVKVPMPGQSLTTLYVRNLPSSAKEEEILGVFQNFGTIREARFQKNKETKEFFGSVFIEYIHASAARLAHVQLNEKTWGDRTVHIDFAKERVAHKEEKPGRLEKAEIALPSNCIYVSNLPQDCDKSVLVQLFSRFGTILDARPLKTETGNAKGIAFIDFVLQESAAAAIDALDNTIYNNKTIKVSYANNPSKRKGEEMGQGDLKRFRGDGVLPTAYPGVQIYYDTTMGYPTDQSQWYAQQGGYY